MSSNLSDLNPSGLWKNFESLCNIPHLSKKEGEIIEFMKNRGETLGLETSVDDIGNVIIRKPATPGMENKKGVILQGHLDMVPEKNSDTEHDFEKDPISAYIDGEWVTANGTTLGADNGIGVAAAMSVLESKDLVHGPIEGLFTIDEETGLVGASGLKPGLLKGDILLNLDAEGEGELYVSCAGGTFSNASFKNSEESVPANSKAYKLNLTGLKGGHSGMDLTLGGGNANKLIFRFMRYAHKNFGLRLAKVNGGSLINAIPREAFATVIVDADKASDFETSLKEYENTYKNELKSVEPDLSFTCESIDKPSSIIDADTQSRLFNAIYACPSGIIRMSNDMEGLIETSTNLSIVKSRDKTIAIQCFLRSSVDSSKDDLENMVESVFQLAGADIIFEGRFPGWKPNMDSEILKIMQNVYNKKWGKIPKIVGIHGGLECGILGSVYPHWDMISFGPTIRFPHSPDEKVNIESVEKFWDLLVETLKNIPAK
ncbi:MAG: aminoacyl-histidine dipeptidase [Bacteroidales bacterium]|nr:aminoacyl-histidine dipeptidase [Bacteroidales bacterium]